LVPSNGLNNYKAPDTGLLASNDGGFVAPIGISPTTPFGTKTNPVLIMTNPMKDIYHNGFNGGFNPVGQGVQNEWPASLLYGDFHLGNGNVTSNKSNNGLLKSGNPATVPPSS
jgi:hypothetical protein